MGVHRAEQSAEIDAPPEVCFEAIADFETFPDWQTAVEAIEVLDRYPDGLGRVIRFHVDAKVRRVVYTLRYHYEAPSRVWWEFIEGDGVEHVDGEFLLDPVDGGTRTRGTYRLGIDVGVPIPGLIARRLAGGVMGRVVTDLRKEAERRVAISN